MYTKNYYKPKEFAELIGVTVKTLQNWDNSGTLIAKRSPTPQKEIVGDVISILHVFSCRLYGLRKYKKQISEDNNLDKDI